MTIVILYGTETGNAEMLAEDLADRLSADHHVKVVAMDGAGPSVFDTDALFLIVTSTYGDGELPASAKPFHAALAAARPSLAGKRFAVFGLGDSQYAETFNFGGRTFQELLESLGARAVAPRGLHDASGKELAEDVAGRWLDEVLVAAETVCPFASLLPEVRANSCPSCVTKSWAGPRVVQSWGDGILCPSGYRITPGEDGPMCTDSSSTRVMPIAAPGTAGAFPLIAAIRGGPGTGASDVLIAFAQARMSEGLSVVGLVVAPAPDGTTRGGPHSHGGHGGEACGCGGALRDLASGEVIGIHQDLGPGSEACNLDTSGLARACAGVERQIAQGVDLVILSRFGGQEAERGGLTAAFQAAVAAGVPVACVVTPKAEEAWAVFAGDLALMLPADLGALEAWWTERRAVRGLAA